MFVLIKGALSHLEPVQPQEASNPLVSGFRGFLYWLLEELVNSPQPLI